MAKPERRMQDWVQRLGAEPLPVLVSSREATAALDLSGDAGVRDIAHIAYGDAALGINLLREANQLRHRHLDTRTSTVDQAIMMLGVQRSLDTVSRWPTVDDALSDASRRGYLQALGRAWHTALQARHWAELRQDVLPAEIATAALVKEVGELSLWRAAPRAMQAIVMLGGLHPQRRRDAEYVVNGVSIGDLGAGLVRHWRLPLLVLEHLVPDKVSGRRTLGLALASSLSRLAPLGWTHPAVMDLVETLCIYLGVDDESVREVIRSVAVRAAQDRAPDLPLVWKPLMEDEDSHLITGDPGGRAFCIIPRGDIAETLLDLCRQGADERTLSDLQLRHGRVEAEDVPLNLALRALYHGYGLARCVFLRIGRDGDSLHAYMAMGCEGDPNLTDLRLDAVTGSFLQELLHQPLPLWMGPAEMERLRKELPVRGRRLFNSHSALMAPVTVNGHAIGLLYADRLEPDCALDEQAHAGMQACIQALEDGLSRLSLTPAG